MERKRKTQLRHRRRAKSKIRTSGTEKCPRLVVFKSNRFLYLQVVDDAQGRVLMAFDNRSPKKPNGIEAARTLGQRAGEVLMKGGFKTARFDRAGYKYHGQIKALGEGLRETGLKI